MTSPDAPSPRAPLPEPEAPPPRIAVVAFGGNALLGPADAGHIGEQIANAEAAVAPLVELVSAGYRLVLVHGNGPQVGHELIRQEEAATKLPPQPLDVCVASTQGTMGYLLERALRNAARGWPGAPEVATLLTQVRVSAHDPAFDKPTKPVGPFLTGYRAEQLQAEQGKPVVEDAGRGWRVVVPSPRPVEILGVQAVRALLDAGLVVIAGGGGGVPIHADAAGGDLGREAVIDKDFTASLLARRLGADTFVILTAVPRVSVYFGTPVQEDLRRVDVRALRHFHAEGQFPPGSMGPKVQAAIEFMDGGGRRCIITTADRLPAALRGEDGTHVLADPAPDEAEDSDAPQMRFEW